MLNFVVYFYVKNKPTKKQINAKIQVTLTHASARKRTEEKILCRSSQQITKLNYKLTLLASDCAFHKVCNLNYLLLLL